MKRSYDAISECRSLEDTVYEYIEHFQEFINGKGVGISCDDLNRNILHPEKPTGIGSEKRFVAMMREMPSLIESEQKWNGKIVFQLNHHVAESVQAKELVAELVQAKELVTTTILNMNRRLQPVHPWKKSASLSTVSREDFEHFLEDLIAANELLGIALKNISSNI